MVGIGRLFVSERHLAFRANLLGELMRYEGVERGLMRCCRMGD
jgi:hypothetical protein